MDIRVVVAYGRGFAIGRKGALPWPQLDQDMARLRHLSASCGVVMGRRTYESIPAKHRPLHGRLNVVLSRTMSPPLADDACSVVPSFAELEAFMRLHADRVGGRWIVLGGAALYRHFLSNPQLGLRGVHTTIVDTPCLDCDAFFPVECLRSGLLRIRSVSERKWDLDKHLPHYRFVDYDVVPERAREAPGAPETSSPGAPETSSPGAPETSGEAAYLRLMRDIVNGGERRADRTGTGTRAVFGRQLRFDLRNGRFPMVTTRATSFRIVALELLWFLRGSTDARELRDEGVRIWDANTSRAFLDARGLAHLPEGDIGPGYGFQWRHFGARYDTCRADYRGAGVDQLTAVLEQLRSDRTSRRICMTAWNAAAVSEMALPPCHSCFVQFYVDGDGGLSCHMYQRSVDCFLGLAANIPSYALLTAILAAMSGLAARELIISTGDTHVYENHVDQVRTQLQREPLAEPRLCVKQGVARKSWEELSLDDFELVGYVHHPAIRAPMAI